jgi:hypothetical protein
MRFDDPAFWRRRRNQRDRCETRNLAFVDGSLWKWSFAALNLGLVGMTGALLVSGFVQAFVERAMGGSTLNAFISAQENVWFVDGMVARFLLAIVFAAGYVVLVWDVLTLGRRARRAALQHGKGHAFEDRIRKADLEDAVDTLAHFIFRSTAIAHRAANSC